ncbi:hypothetical protein B0T16DRAFT_388753 [Cercophora newfieldiana]|uniref:Uncharacterized protein n=1 Tax=Cercophora newfieldiana TaxID=92897 RepID=A0AA39Y9K7_9PEZI|nr:hypothetical protein B0T16DRAFT_388753 [Cercophora newfieldiana]
MKFSSSSRAVAAAVGLLVQVADAKSVVSDVYGWQYELDTTVPTILTKDEMFTIGDAHNKTVSIELVDGTMMLVDQLAKKQVATFGGALDEWARAAYPSPALIASMKKSGELDEVKAGLNGILGAVAAGAPMDKALAAHKAEQEVAGLTKRNCLCIGPVYVCSDLCPAWPRRLAAHSLVERAWVPSLV